MLAIFEEIVDDYFRLESGVEIEGIFIFGYFEIFQKN